MVGDTLACGLLTISFWLSLCNALEYLSSQSVLSLVMSSPSRRSRMEATLWVLATRNRLPDLKWSTGEVTCLGGTRGAEISERGATEGEEGDLGMVG